MADALAGRVDCADDVFARLDLASFPHRFPLVLRYENQAVRRRVYGDYLIFCRIDPDRIVILHILIGSDQRTLVLACPPLMADLRPPVRTAGSHPKDTGCGPWRG